ncbi:MAG TPA: hypothetical protein VEC35_01020 [Noviherbaspirillum sp.]|nr:hypothetical protein [Noviherbaspirillum sp.]
MKAARNSQVGDKVCTDFSGRLTVHTIVDRRDGWQSQSRIGFKLSPIVPGSQGSWIDADWFVPFNTPAAG